MGSSLKARVLAGVSVAALGAWALPAAAQQAKPGDPQCPVTGTETICTGNLNQGIAIVTADNVNSLIIRNLNAPIAPASGLSGINFIRTTGPVSVRVEDSARGINTTNGNGIEAYAYDDNITLFNAAPITGRVRIAPTSTGSGRGSMTPTMSRMRAARSSA
jgi:hypothetical protein